MLTASDCSQTAAWLWKEWKSGACSRLFKFD
jgi:hypothetical protein